MINMKLTDVQTKLIVWVVAFLTVATLIGMGKIPAASLGYFLTWAAGTVGGAIKLPGASQGAGEPNGQP